MFEYNKNAKIRKIKFELEKRRIVIMQNNNIKSKEEYARENLESYVKDYKIFMDTCSLLHFAVEKYWTNIIPLLHKYNSKVIIPLRTLDEIEKHSKNLEDKKLAEIATNCKKILHQLMSAEYIEVRGESTDNFADNVFQVVFTKFRLNYNLLLITQDNDLAKDILALNDNRSVKANPVIVKRINQYGFLSDFSWNEQSQGNEKKKSTKIRKEDISLEADEIFKICNEITTLPDKKLHISNMPSENDIVYAPQGQIKLTKELGAGGEAVVYETNTPYVAKIYKKENITTRKYEKIKLMLTKKIDCKGICYPVTILYNQNKEFI